MDFRLKIARFVNLHKLGIDYEESDNIICTIYATLPSPDTQSYLAYK